MKKPRAFRGIVSQISPRWICSHIRTISRRSSDSKKYNKTPDFRSLSEWAIDPSARFTRSGLHFSEPIVLMHSWRKMLLFIRTSSELFGSDVQSSIIRIFILTHTIAALTLRESEEEVSFHALYRDDRSLIILCRIVRSAHYISPTRAREDRLRGCDLYVPKWLCTSRAVRRSSTSYWWSRYRDLTTYSDGYGRVGTRSI
jgi:hypothetical protein